MKQSIIIHQLAVIKLIYAAITEVEISDVTVENLLSVHNQSHNVPVFDRFQVDLVTSFPKYICDSRSTKPNLDINYSK